uniref:phosphate ABC transporter permease PstA n=1 Tax=Ningiella ruwaisensis TaxID=2364274 RepID=UPI00109EFEE7|nr:phosphate ABC transporter permease PstA [Ningiella ruwaisensis]
MLKKYLNHFKHSLAETSAMLCVSSLIIFLIAMVLFIGFKGGQYFVPQSIYKVVVSFNDGPASDEAFYQASSLSAEALQTQYLERYQGQFLSQPELRPGVSVTPAEQVYQINTRSGPVYFGEFYALSSPEQELHPLTELENLKQAVDLLERSLNEVQGNKLSDLHSRIAALNNSDVAKEAPARQDLMDEFSKWQLQASALKTQIQQFQMRFKEADGSLVSVPLIEIDELFQANQLTQIERIGFTLNKLWQFIADKPKQAATTGGVFPAIFGTVLMVLLMAVVVAPFGIIAAIYLHEYAPDNKITGLIRIGISNMAAVPSIVYGVFGLGFFVYVLGGSLDALFYSNTLPSPTFGTPGLLWASLTMGLLTLPVVIVSAEEGLKRVPEGLRAGSYALGATKYETVLKVVVPMASPGMLTGVILAIARAAGEVAPLILVGAVKFAPNLPIDAEFPFVHLERQFMHLGVFIYDGAFHNQTQTQSASLMFATCMLLLIIVFLLNISAIMFRHRLKTRYERH